MSYEKIDIGSGTFDISSLKCFASIKSEVIVENKDLYKGDSLIVTIRLNQDSHKDEINILQGIIEYDESLFEDIDEDSF